MTYIVATNHCSSSARRTSLLTLLLRTTRDLRAPARRLLNGVYLFLLPLLLAALPVFAQTGTPPFGSFGGGPDVINLANLNAHIAIPVLHKAGRGTDFTYDLSYDTSAWSPAGTTWQPVLNWGWRGQTEALTGYMTRNFLILRTCRNRQGQIIGQQYMYYNWTYHDPFGTPYRYSGQTIFVSGTCGTGQDFTETEGIYTLSTNGGSFTLNDSFGKFISPPFGTTSGSGSFGDRNGNSIGVDSNGNFTDTLGTTVLTTPVRGPPQVQ